MRGKFAVFEGIDGCGKTTQLSMAAQYFFSLPQKIDLVLTREPTSQLHGTKIKERISVEKDPFVGADWFAEQFWNDRNQHVQQLIQPSLDFGLWVLCDRYKYANIVYQSIQGMDSNELISRNRLFPIPDLVLVFDVPVSVALNRLKQRKSPGRKFEKKEFLEKLRKNFLELPKQLPRENIAVIDASASQETVFKKAKKELEKLH